MNGRMGNGGMGNGGMGVWAADSICYLLYQYIHLAVHQSQTQRGSLQNLPPQSPRGSAGPPLDVGSEQPITRQRERERDNAHMYTIRMSTQTYRSD